MRTRAAGRTGDVRDGLPLAKRIVPVAAAKAAAAGGPHGDGLVVLRADSAFYGHDVVAAARRAGARFSITARSSPAVSTAIASIRDDAWTPIHYPNAVWDEAEQHLISDAEIAEVPFTAFTSRRTADHISGRLIVRRVKRLNPTAKTCLLYTSDAADEEDSVDLGGRRIIKKKKTNK